MGDFINSLGLAGLALLNGKIIKRQSLFRTRKSYSHLDSEK